MTRARIIAARFLVEFARFLAGVPEQKPQTQQKHKSETWETSELAEPYTHGASSLRLIEPVAPMGARAIRFADELGIVEHFQGDRVFLRRALSNDYPQGERVRVIH